MLTAMLVPYREHFTEPIQLGEGFRLHKERCGRQLEAICHLQTHQLGWEVVLTVNASLQRSEVCRSQDEVPRLDGAMEDRSDREGVALAGVPSVFAVVVCRQGRSTLW